MQPADRVANDLLLRLKNATSSAAVVIIACAIYGLSPFNQQSLGTLYGPAAVAITGYGFLVAGAGAYVVLLTIYFMVQHEVGISKSLRFFRVAARSALAPVQSFRSGLSSADRLAVLSTVLKSFFGPMMAVFLMTHCMGAWRIGLAMLDPVCPRTAFSRCSTASVTGS